MRNTRIKKMQALYLVQALYLGRLFLDVLFGLVTLPVLTTVFTVWCVGVVPWKVFLSITLSAFLFALYMDIRGHLNSLLDLEEE